MRFSLSFRWWRLRYVWWDLCRIRGQSKRRVLLLLLHPCRPMCTDWTPSRSSRTAYVSPGQYYLWHRHLHFTFLLRPCLVSHHPLPSPNFVWRHMSLFSPPSLTCRLLGGGLNFFSQFIYNKINFFFSVLSRTQSQNFFPVRGKMGKTKQVLFLSILPLDTTLSWYFFFNVRGKMKKMKTIQLKKLLIIFNFSVESCYIRTSQTMKKRRGREREGGGEILKYTN